MIVKKPELSGCVRPKLISYAHNSSLIQMGSSGIFSKEELHIWFIIPAKELVFTLETQWFSHVRFPQPFIDISICTDRYRTY